MEKNIEWLKDEILTDMRYLEGNREIQQLDIKYQTLREVVQKINSLDEPETLSQDWIVDNVSFIQAGRGYVLGSRLQNLLVPKQELPVIPKIVAEVIEEHKELGYDVYDSINLIIETNGEGLPSISNWVARNIDKYARAWLDGSTVEEEQKYYVMNNENELLLSKNKDDEVITYSQYYPQVRKVLSDLSHYQLTEQEIKDYDPRYWAFRKPVEELGK